MRLTCPESRGAVSLGPEREAEVSRESGGASLGPECEAHLSRESGGASLVPEREADLSRSRGGGWVSLGPECEVDPSRELGGGGSPVPECKVDLQSPLTGSKALAPRSLWDGACWLGDVPSLLWKWRGIPAFPGGGHRTLPIAAWHLSVAPLSQPPELRRDRVGRSSAHSHTVLCCFC